MQLLLCSWKLPLLKIIQSKRSLIHAWLASFGNLYGMKIPNQKLLFVPQGSFIYFHTLPSKPLHHHHHHPTSNFGSTSTDVTSRMLMPQSPYQLQSTKDSPDILYTCNSRQIHMLFLEFVLPHGKALWNSFDSTYSTTSILCCN